MWGKDNMAKNRLLDEISSSTSNALKKRLTEAFDTMIDKSDDEVIEGLKIELIEVFKGRISEVS